MKRSLKVKVDDIPTPFLAVDRKIFQANIESADNLFRGKEKFLRPHFKTHRTPGLLLLQMTSFTIGVTCATVGEAETALSSGISDILIANTFASNDKIRRIANMAEKAKIMVAIDSEEHIRMLSGTGAQIGVLLEIDTGLHRCGISDYDTARKLAVMAASSEGISFKGIMGYEGRFRKSAAARGVEIQRAYSKLAEAKDNIESEGIKVEVVSSAGTSTLYEALGNPVITEIQAGTYSLMEPDIMDLGLPFELAACVTGTVISTASGFVILDAGRRSVSIENGLPVCLDPSGKVLKMNDEHGILEWKGTLPPLGSRIALLPTQNRTTFNLHNNVWLVDEDRNAEKLPVKARGMSN